MTDQAPHIAAQKSPAYRWGWDWAALGMELHHWLIPHLGVQWDDAQIGWQDYHDQARSGGRG